MMLVSIGLSGCAGLVRDQMYVPPVAQLSRAALGADVGDIVVTTADGLQLRGLVRAPSDDKPVILFFHGNASSASGVMDWLKPALDGGYGFVSAEYRGYSRNPGKPTQTGLARDADAFLAHARGVARKRPVYVVGHSLGGAVAFDLARRHRLDLLITIGTFTSVSDVAPKIARAFLPDPFDSRGAVAGLDEPLILVHGDKDTVISPWHGGQLQNAAVAAKRQGASVVLLNQGHQPDGAVLTQVFDAISKSEGDLRKFAAAAPDGTRIVPF